MFVTSFTDAVVLNRGFQGSKSVGLAMQQPSPLEFLLRCSSNLFTSARADGWQIDIFQACLNKYRTLCTEQWAVGAMSVTTTPIHKKTLETTLLWCSNEKTSCIFQMHNCQGFCDFPIDFFAPRWRCWCVKWTDLLKDNVRHDAKWSDQEFF